MRSGASTERESRAVSKDAEVYETVSGRVLEISSPVGAYEHHFAVWFNCVEQSIDYYAVSKDGVVDVVRGLVV